ncbi:MAG: holin [Peptococcaceae bacterium]|nr:holin [Peptococcaceae bacterium]
MDITPLCMAVMALAAVVITLYLVPWIKSKTTKEQRESINALVKIAVQAAEQIFAGAGRGEEKKAYVMDFLAKKNLKIDMAELDKLIEAAVLAVNKGVL